MLRTAPRRRARPAATTELRTPSGRGLASPLAGRPEHLKTPQAPQQQQLHRAVNESPRLVEQQKKMAAAADVAAAVGGLLLPELVVGA